MVFCFSLPCFFHSSDLFANNLEIENVALTGQDSGNKTIVVEFDISWDNSWRNYINYDAVWVFVKYSDDSGLTWKHATLKNSGTNPDGFSQGTGTGVEILVSEDMKGCFIQRYLPGAGSINVDSIQIVWDWNADGLTESDNVRVKVFGIEMVYIPQSSFYVGDGNVTSESMYAFHEDGADNAAVQITTSSKDITCDLNGNDDIDDSPVSVDGNGGITGNGSFPTGYNAFYVMKYEITEEQWVEFFNTLTSSQKSNRDITGANGKNNDSTVHRNTVSWTSGDATTSRPDRPCSYLSWMDLCAYADWSALRPMTELEFEKIARGPNTASYGEYVWGNNAITAASNISGAEDGTETITNTDANCCYNSQTFTGGDSGTGPLRVGIFATSDSWRSDAGAAYYGVMELSGNLWERCVTLGNSLGRLFSGTHGDGELETIAGYEGNATNSDWPGFVDGEGVSGANGSGFRGGSWLETAAAKMAISDRSEASLTRTTRDSDTGGRCVRTAP